MSELKPGAIIWTDLTVPNAEEVRDFYRAVVGWTTEPEDMEEYEDYSMLSPATGERVAGVCHARGTNANVPPQWLVYIAVEDVQACAAKCVELGGGIVDGPRLMGRSMFCVIRDPAGAVCALFETAKSGDA